MGSVEQGATRSRQLADELTSRAKEIAKRVSANGSKYTGDFDLVISGGGDLDGYAMGVIMVASHVLGLSLERFSGASAGGELLLEVALRGGTETLASHLSYGMIQEAFPSEFSNALYAAASQDQLLYYTLAGLSIRTLETSHLF